MSQETLVKLECEKCGNISHHTTRNKKIKTKLVLSKYCSECKAHTNHKETK